MIALVCFLIFSYSKNILFYFLFSPSIPIGSGYFLPSFVSSSYCVFPP